MSVAFRRESDEEHREPRFELPLPSGPNLVTERGLALIEERIAALTEEQSGADEMRATEIARELRYWNTRRVTAVLAPRPPEVEVAFGSRVRFTLNGKVLLILCFKLVASIQEFHQCRNCSVECMTTLNVIAHFLNGFMGFAA